MFPFPILEYTFFFFSLQQQQLLCQHSKSFVLGIQRATNKCVRVCTSQARERERGSISWNRDGDKGLCRAQKLVGHSVLTLLENFSYRIALLGTESIQIDLFYE